MAGSDMASGPTYDCPPLTSYCDHALPWAPCTPTLADARSSFCAPDGGVRFYYDGTSGMLVAIVDESANFGGSSQCVGGPATFTSPSCQPLVAFCG